MVAELNHTIVWCSDKHRSAAHLVEILGLDEPYDFADVFLVVNMGNCVSLDYANWPHGKVTPQHLAFLVSDDEFDAAYTRIKANDLSHWADPTRRLPGQINHHDGGRGVYWEDPEDGHDLEIITRPCGAETEALG